MPVEDYEQLSFQSPGDGIAAVPDEAVGLQVVDYGAATHRSALQRCVLRANNFELSLSMHTHAHSYVQTLAQNAHISSRRQTPILSKRANYLFFRIRLKHFA